MEKSVWTEIRSDYKLKEELGAGSYGLVMKAKHRTTKKTVAIKLVTNIFKDCYIARKTLREIKIMRKLAKMKNNVYTAKLLDIIIPQGASPMAGLGEEVLTCD